MTRTPDQLRQDLLVLQAQSGDRDALEQLVRLWQTRLWSVALAKSGDHDAAWEISQEAWVEIFRGLRGLREAEAFGRWATRIVSNIAAQRIRRRQRHVRALEKIADQSTTVASTDDAHFERKLLSALPTSQRTIIILHYFEKLEVMEIAEMLDIPAGTVKSRLYYARKKLRDMLGDHHGKERCK